MTINEKNTRCLSCTFRMPNYISFCYVILWKKIFINTVCNLLIFNLFIRNYLLRFVDNFLYISVVILLQRKIAFHQKQVAIDLTK